MVCRVFANCKVGDLHKVKSKLNQTGYNSLLDETDGISHRTNTLGEGMNLPPAMGK